MPEFVGGNREERFVAKREPQHQPTRHRAQDHRAEHPRVEVSDDFLQGEQDRGDRGVEGRGDRRRRPDRYQLPPLLGVQPEGFSHRGSDPGSDLRGRPLAPQRDAGAQREHPAEVLPEGHAEWNPAIVRDQRRLRLRNPASPRLAEPPVHQEAGGQRPQYRAGKADRAERLPVNHHLGEPFGHHDEGHDDRTHQRSDREIETREEPGPAKQLP